MVPRRTQPPELFIQLLRKVVDRDRPYGLEEPLKINAPQALLRDLHRPVSRYEITGFEPAGEGIDRGGRVAMREIKALMRTNFKVPIKTLLDTPALYRECLAERKAAMGGKWEDAPKLGFGATTSELYPVFAPPIEDEVAGW
jgi:hypothetical protein